MVQPIFFQLIEFFSEKCNPHQFQNILGAQCLQQAPFPGSLNQLNKNELLSQFSEWEETWHMAPEASFLTLPLLRLTFHSH